MARQQSIRKNFLVQLLISSASLILIFSSLLYFYIEKSIYDEKRDELIHYAQNISNYKSIYDLGELPDNFLSLSVEVISLTTPLEQIDVYEKTIEQQTFLTLIYPFDIQNNVYLKLIKDITPTKRLLKKILNYIFIINIAGFLLVILYAVALSKMLAAPIRKLSQDLSNMNEHLMKPIQMDEIPQEFAPLAGTINHLIARIQTFVKYQKELFIGTAHELKTPLAVIKLKNQVTLIKKRPPEEYIEAIKTTNKTVDEMNIIVSNILNIGRQEGAQLDKPQQVDIIDLLQQKANDFKLLAENEGKTLEISFTPNVFMATIQVGLLNQIVQNFLQNALKFTPPDKKVILRSVQDDFGLLIEVIDEGCGIDESVDLYAPFKRQGNKSGVGLGLFLAKSAADALGAKISLKNREDGVDGTIASLQLNSQLSCIIPRK
ncbi:HAMP domain-containing sensor histidine kinase [Sulfurimonas sp. C5]|uniref:sensor histidine kinase n=1 Tax=Sulfurimonas sp. C5 TaxID=3036947 RepID=UPI002453C152|nr:HAMP domain-containing sensor histidine kinase [Sulfurimonas sp. C5]MDH4945363.1 HAMP domain-containing sensor histidine kinase [Sulfurimonas sp. C5]